MSYQIQEQSEHSGRIREIYRFSLDTQTWLVTSAAEKITYQFNDYLPLEIARSEPEQSREKGRSGLVITVPRDFAVARLFVGVVPYKPVNVTLQRLHEGDGEVVDFWTGRVRAVEKRGDLKTDLKCETNISMLQRVGLRERFQCSCNEPLYTLRCGVPKSAFAVPGAAQSIIGKTIKSDAWINPDTTWFRGGVLERANGDLRTVIAAGTDGTLTLRSMFDGTLAPGEILTAYAGCNHTFAHCSTRFAAHTNNGEAFVGYPTIPSQNPHETGIL